MYNKINCIGVLAREAWLVLVGTPLSSYHHRPRHRLHDSSTFALPAYFIGSTISDISKSQSQIKNKEFEWFWITNESM